MQRRNIITADEAKQANAKFIDARWYMPTDPRKAKDAYLASHIEGAVFLDIDAVSTPDQNHPHLMPTPETMALFLSRHGISENDLVVVYDDTGFFSAPRGWWMLKALGHEKVYVLEGGLNSWRDKGYPLATGEEAPQSSEAHYTHKTVQIPLKRHQVQTHLAQGKAVVDARSRGRFTGVDPEPRPSLPSGAMPGALNLPFNEVVDETGQMLATEALREKLSELGLAPDQEIVATCGSGITACVLLLAMTEAGFANSARLYDGSWIDWASAKDSEIVRAPSA